MVWGSDNGEPSVKELEVSWEKIKMWTKALAVGRERREQRDSRDSASVPGLQGLIEI